MAKVTLLLTLGKAIILWQALLLGSVQLPGDIPTYFDLVLQEANLELIQPQNPLVEITQNGTLWNDVALDVLILIGLITALLAAPLLLTRRSRRPGY